jgi:hypothetical protein
MGKQRDKDEGLDFSAFESEESSKNQEQESLDFSVFEGDKKKSTQSGGDGQPDQQLPKPETSEFTNELVQEAISDIPFEEDRESKSPQISKTDYGYNILESIKEEKDKKIPVSREAIQESVKSLKNTFENLESEYSAKNAILDSLQSEHIGIMPGGYPRYKYDEEGNAIKMSREEVEERDKRIENLDQEVQEKGSYIYNGNDLIDKTENILYLSEHPEGFKAFGRGVGSGVVNYFKDYQKVINEISGAKYINNLKEKIDKANKKAAELSGEKEDLLEDIETKEEKIGKDISTFETQSKQLKKQKEQIDSFEEKAKEGELTKKQRNDYKELVDTYNQTVKDLKSLGENIKKERDVLKEEIEEYNKELGVDFTEEEKFFIKATQTHQKALEDIKDQIPYSAEIGESIGHSLAFMGEFALTAGAGKGILSGAKGLSGLKGFGVKATRTALRSGVQTLKMPSFMKETVRGLADDEQGVVKDVWNSFYDTYWEVLPERMFMGALNVGKTGTALDKMLQRTGNALAGKRGAKGVLLGIAEETLEEEISTFAHSVKRRDNFSEVMKDMTDLEGQLKTIGTVSILTGTLGAANVSAPKVRELANNSIAKFKLNRAGKKIDKDVKGDVDAMIENENSSMESIVKGLNRVAQNYATGEAINEEKSKQRYVDVMEYASWKMRDEAYKQRSKIEKELKKQEKEGKLEGQTTEEGVTPEKEKSAQKTTTKPKVEQIEKEGEKPQYKIGTIVYENKKDFINKVQELGGEDTTPDIQIQNDPKTAKEVEGILQEGLRETDQEKEKSVQKEKPKVKSEIEKPDFKESQKEVNDEGKVLLQKAQQLDEEIMKESLDPEKSEKFTKAQEAEKMLSEGKSLREVGQHLGMQEKALKSKNLEKKIQDKIKRDKSVPKAVQVEKARSKLQEYINDNKKELSKLSGRAVPTMLKRVNEIKTEASYNRALNYIDKYVKDQKFREKENKKQEDINKILSEISETKLTWKTEAKKRKAKKKGEVFAGYIDRTRRIRKLMTGSLKGDPNKIDQKYNDAVIAEQMLEQGVDVKEVADQLNMTEKSKKASDLKNKIKNKISKAKKDYQNKTSQVKEAVEYGKYLTDVIGEVETELNNVSAKKGEDVNDAIKKIRNKIGQVDGSIEINNLEDVEVALQILKQDLQFQGMQYMSADQVAEKRKAFEEYKDKTFEEVKKEIEQRRKEYEELINNTLKLIDPKGKTARTAEDKAMKRKRYNNMLSFLEVRDFWATLDAIDTQSNTPLGGDLVNRYVQIIRGGEMKSKELLLQYRDDFLKLQEEVFGKKGLQKKLKDYRVAPGTQGETLQRRIEESGGAVEKMVVEKVPVLDEAGNQVKDKEGKPAFLPLNQMVAAKKWLELQDPTLEETFFGEEGMGYTQHHVRTIEEYLNDDTKEFASRIMNEFLPKYYEEFNKVYREMNGVDLPRNEFYTPIFRDVEGESFDTNILIESQPKFATVNNGHTTERTRNRRALQYVDLMQSIDSYMRKMIHYSAYAKPLKEVAKVFRYSSEVREAVKQNHGTSYLRDIDNYINDLSENDNSREYKLVQKMSRNIVYGTLAGKLNQMVKQFSSFGAGFDYLGVDGMYEAFRNFAANPKKQIDFTLQNPILKERRQSGSFDPDAALSLAKKYSKLGKKTNWKQLFMLPTKAGDMAPIFLLYPQYYKKAYKEAKEQGYNEEDAKERAKLFATDEVLQWQQSTFMSDLANPQRHKDISRLFVMYATSPISYHQKAASGLRHMIRGAKNKDLKTFSRGAKSFFVGHVLVPHLYTYFLNGFRFDEDDHWQTLILGNLNAIPLLGQALEFGVNSLFGEPFDFSASPLFDLPGKFKRGIESTTELFDSIEDEMEDVSFYEVWDIATELANTIAIATGLPGGLLDTMEGVRATAQNETSDWIESTGRILGWTEWQLTPNKAVLDPRSREVMRAMMEGKGLEQFTHDMRKKHSPQHIQKYLNDYVEEYQMRKRLDPTYTYDLITDIQQAQGNKEKKKIILDEIKDMPRYMAHRFIVKLISPFEVNRYDEKGNIRKYERTTLISKETGMEILQEYEEEKKQ